MGSDTPRIAVDVTEIPSTGGQNQRIVKRCDCGEFTRARDIERDTGLRGKVPRVA